MWDRRIFLFGAFVTAGALEIGDRAPTASCCLLSFGGKFGERFGLVKDAGESSRRHSRCFRILDKADPASFHGK
jgi:hypothetical protein